MVKRPVIGLLWKQKLMDETSEYTKEAINKLLRLGMSIERIADRLDLDLEFSIITPIPDD